MATAPAPRDAGFPASHGLSSLRAKTTSAANGSPTRAPDEELGTGVARSLDRAIKVLRRSDGPRYFRRVGSVIVGFLLAGTLMFWMLEPTLSAVDAFYLTGVSITTIGFGDFAPRDALTRCVMFLYSLVGLGFFGLVTAEAARFRSLFGLESPLLLAASMLVGSLALGTLLFSLVEGWSLQDAAWFSYVTSTTVGYGDLSVETDLGKCVVVFYSILTLAPMAFVTTTIGHYVQKQVGLDAEIRDL